MNFYLLKNATIKFEGEYRQGMIGRFGKSGMCYLGEDGRSDSEDKKNLSSSLQRMVMYYSRVAPYPSKCITLSVFLKGPARHGELQILEGTSLLKDLSNFFGVQNVHVKVTISQFQHKLESSMECYMPGLLTAVGSITTKEMDVMDKLEKTCGDESIRFPDTTWDNIIQTRHPGNVFISGRVTLQVFINTPISICATQLIKPNRMALYEKMLHDEVHSDVVIIPSNGNPVKCHKSFLSACSAVWETMFKTDMVESKTWQVKLPDMSEEGIKAFLQFVYYLDEDEPNKDSGIAFELLNAGHKYGVIPDMEGAMAKLLLSKPVEWFDVDVTVNIILLAMKLPSREDLTKKCVQVLKGKADDLPNSPTYRELFLKNPTAAMELCQLLIVSK